MIYLSKWIVLLFGLFLVMVGFLMLLNPKKARETLQKAGSTNFINYAEITIRIIPAAAMVIYADYSKFTEFFHLLGWFMILTSAVLYLVPRKLHHAYAMKSASYLKPLYIRFLSLFSFIFGGFIIYCVM